MASSEGFFSGIWKTVQYYVSGGESEVKQGGGEVQKENEVISESVLEPEIPIGNLSIENKPAEIDSENSKEKMVCKFFLAGKCRFGDECRNLHEGGGANVKVPKQNSPSEGHNKGKLPPMRTARDVISRIQWDENLPDRQFFVGYKDRFLGLVEKPFLAFTWEDLASVDYDSLCIPQHSIQYFKYKGEIVWDKRFRLDLVFGSTDKNTENFLEVMRKIDDEVDMGTVDRYLQSSEDEDDSEDDFQIELPQQPAIMKTFQHDMKVPDSERSTHFFAIRVTDPEVAKKAKLVQDGIINSDPLLASCCMRSSLLHITLAMVRIESMFAVEEAVDILQDINARKNELLSSPRQEIKIKGLSTFGNRVVYAEMSPPEDFWKLADLVREKLDTAGPGLKGTNLFDFKPHMTLSKVSRPVAKERRSKFIDPSSYIKYKDLDFGVQRLDNLHLCIIDENTRVDGFYDTEGEIHF